MRDEHISHFPSDDMTCWKSTFQAKRLTKSPASFMEANNSHTSFRGAVYRFIINEMVKSQLLALFIVFPPWTQLLDMARPLTLYL